MRTDLVVLATVYIFHINNLATVYIFHINNLATVYIIHINNLATVYIFHINNLATVYIFHINRNLLARTIIHAHSGTHFLYGLYYVKYRKCELQSTHKIYLCTERKKKKNPKFSS